MLINQSVLREQKIFNLLRVLLLSQRNKLLLQLGNLLAQPPRLSLSQGFEVQLRLRLLLYSPGQSLHRDTSHINESQEQVSHPPRKQTAARVKRWSWFGSLFFIFLFFT